jgi:hypothetical protein
MNFLSMLVLIPPYIPCLESEGQHEDPEGAPKVSKEACYEEPDLSGRVEGVDYTIAYGVSGSHEEESNNYFSNLVA